MSDAKRRVSSARLHLVVNTSSAVALPVDREATIAGPMPEGWFAVEVGYIGETTTGTRVLTDAQRQRSD